MDINELYLKSFGKEFFNCTLSKGKSNTTNLLKNNKFLSFDQSIHQTMGDFNMVLDKEKRTIETLFGFLINNWIAEGYESFREEQQFKIRAHNMLLNYYYNPQDVGVDNLITNKMLRKRINKRTTLFTRIDKVFEREDGSIEVVDYKSGYVIRHTRGFPIDFKSALSMVLVYYKLNIYPNYISYYYLNYNKKVTRDITYRDIEEASSLINKFLNIN